MRILVSLVALGILCYTAVFSADLAFPSALSQKIENVPGQKFGEVYYKAALNNSISLKTEMKNPMKKLLLSALMAITGVLHADAQKFDNVTWSFEVVQKGCEAELIATATIADGWYIYSQNQPNTDGPIATGFTFTASKAYSKVGKVSESKSKSKFMEGFGGEYNIMEHKAVFKQKVKVISAKNFEIKGEIEFMQCDESKCLPPAYVPFTFKIKGCVGGADVVEEVQNETEEPEATVVEDSLPSSVTPVGFKIYSKKYSDNEYELFVKLVADSGWVVPAEATSQNGMTTLNLQFQLPAGVEKAGDLKMGATREFVSEKFGKFKAFVNDAVFSQRIKVNTNDSLLLRKLPVGVEFMALHQDVKYKLKDKLTADINLHEAEDMHATEKHESYWAIFLVAFLSGFAALLTPCVFPMIPMTVSFFLKSSKDRKKGISNAIIYGLSIIGIYVVLGLLITVTLGPTALNEMSTSLVFNLLFFLILVIFAISFFGAFEIVLPSKWVNAADKNADKGGLLGIFFMAFVLALVSFSCTGPIVGTLLVESVSKGIMGPIFGMLGFSMAIALPFTLFAIFPGFLNSMPSSGGWLNTVKVSLGFIELALSLKFLSKADLVYQTHLLEREVFLAIFIAVLALWGFYLLGMFKLSHDSDHGGRISSGRTVMAVLVFSFMMYLIPGLWGAPVNLLAGIAPPMEYSESPYGVGNRAPEGGKAGEEGMPEHAEYGPHQLVTFHDYEHGMAYAREKGLPALIDFTGYGCENCRKMEQNVWSAEKNLQLMRDSMVIISLHVDERTKLDPSDPDAGKFRNVGQKWADMEVRIYGESSQPLYVMLDANGEMLNSKASYQTHGEVNAFYDWMTKGIQTFAKRKGVKVVRPELIAAN
jgi:thiol:disulfide interchange protein DsbD